MTGVRDFFYRLTTPPSLRALEERARRSELEAKDSDQRYAAVLELWKAEQAARIAARNKLEPFKSMPAAQRPTFHEIRGLGSRLYRAAGVPEDAIQALMTHSSRRTTQIYLERGAAALTDEDYHEVSATLRVRDVLGGSRG